MKKKKRLLITIIFWLIVYLLSSALAIFLVEAQEAQRKFDNHIRFCAAVGKRLGAEECNGE